MSEPVADPDAVDERDLAARVEALTLRQKVRLLTGADAWALHAEPVVGLRRIVVSDGPAGVRGERWDERDPAANLPSATSLAASWDETLAEELGGLLAAEARRKNVDVVLAPTLNLHRTPYAGRHFECFSEDPLLTARIGAAYVRGLQAGGVAATAKHFVANDSETQRMTVDVHVADPVLRELYLAPFQAAVQDGGAWLVMASYNGVNGHPMTESPLLRDVLRDEFGFDGVIISDWFATQSTAASARAGLDLVMPGPDGPWGRALMAAVRKGEVDEAAVDAKVLAILRLAARVGALDGREARRPQHYGDAEIAATLRRAAARGFVLTRNCGVLPLDRAQLRRVAVIGDNAATARTLGGGSATVFPPYTVSPLDGLRTALAPDVVVEHRIGARAGRRVPVADASRLRRPDGAPGVEVRFLAADGALLGAEHRQAAALRWPRSLRHNGALAWVEMHTTVVAGEPGTYRIGVSGIGRYRLSIDGRPVLDERLRATAGADVMETLTIPPQTSRPVVLQRGQEVAIIAAHEVGTAAGELGDNDLSFALNLLSPHGSEEDEIKAAVDLAAGADAAVVVVGTTPEVESEGFDRSTLALPGAQDELVRRVASVNPRTVVVVNAGAPVLLPWADEVGAVLLAWFPGQEFGNALVDVLLGDAEPGGRLPTSWPKSETGLPSVTPSDGVLTYSEGHEVGYRGHAPARYPFGHGLGYTRWEYIGVTAPEAVSPGAGVEANVRVRNCGPRAGREVVQVYAGRPGSAVNRPARWLAGFAVVEADPGEEVAVTVPVAPRAFQHWDPRRQEWAIEPGRFTLAAASSSASPAVSTEVVAGVAGRRAVPTGGRDAR